MKNIDVVIVGAGVAGGLVADALVTKGHRVLVLEAGPENQNRGQLLERYFSDPNRSFDSAYPSHPEAPRPAANGQDGYYVQKGTTPFSSTYERRVGGTSWHWHGLTPRFMPNDFRMQSMYQVGVDWPISYGDLEPWYCAAEKELNVSGGNNTDFGSPRSQPFPYPSQRQSPLDLHIKQAIKGTFFNNVELDVRPNRAARNPKICQGSANCMPICPTGAKYEAITHINRARVKGVIIRSKAVATRVEIDKEGDVSTIHYKTWDGRKHKVRAKMFILAANAIETPKLLLMSAREGNVNVANSSDQVGRNLMDHPAQLSIALAKEPIDAYRGPQSTSVIMSFRDGDFRKTEGGFRVEIFNSGSNTFSGPDRTVATMIDANLVGEELQQALKNRASREFILLGETEQMPDPENRVLLSSEKQDAFGLPHPELHYSHDNYATKGLAKIKKFNEFVFEKVGASDVFHLPFILGSGHIMGTTRMGNNPNESVVDVNLQSHDHPNLFIVGSGVFPTGATANPTLTIAALSLRLADYVHGRLSK
jgi:choline dehydrogenase-like flavoprotein|tara:strand:+ start:32061 stop:33665 length:1605 start_codon:yes stop_codon:yes gene_type:complete